jgi:hypothetical protein
MLQARNFLSATGLLLYPQICCSLVSAYVDWISKCEFNNSLSGRMNGKRSLFTRHEYYEGDTNALSSTLTKIFITSNLKGSIKHFVRPWNTCPWVWRIWPSKTMPVTGHGGLWGCGMLRSLHWLDSRFIDGAGNALLPRHIFSCLQAE